MVNLKIDGIAVQIEKGATLLAAAEKAGITIPTLCFLKKVSPTGACRICVVEIEGVDKPMAACHTVAIDGMQVTTQSPRLLAIRRQIVELLLVNHPLDCPVCDAGGECELQDVCYDFDVDKQPFEAENVNPDPIDRWPLIQQVPSRCILCEKCVKVCHETIGSSALFINDRGDRAFIDKHLELCEFCGNCVQVCPTGTMISKTFKFRARPWELARTASVCTTCGSHCEVEIHSKKNCIYRVTSEDGTTHNDGNLCNGGFFGHDYSHAARLANPTAGRGPQHHQVSWGEALEQFSAKVREVGGTACAGLTGGRLTNEENYLFQKLFRVGFGSNNIDSEASFGYLRAAATLRRVLGLQGASQHVDRIGRSAAILVFGADPTAEAPAIDWQIERSLRRTDGKLVVANLRKVKLNRHAHTPLQYRPGSEVALANALTRLVVELGLADQAYLNQYLANRDELETLLRRIDLDQAVAATGLSLSLLEEAARHLGEATSVAVIFGADITGGAHAREATQALANLALVCGALHGDIGGLFPLDEKGNIQGTIDMGVAPGLLPGQLDYSAGQARIAKLWGCPSLPDNGLGAEEILEGIEAGRIKLLYLAGTNPLISYPESQRWRLALEKLEYLVVQDIQASELTEMADLLLPAAVSAEKAGSVTAIDGRVSYLVPALAPFAESRPDLDIFSALLKGCGGQVADLADLQNEIKQVSGLYEDICFTPGGRKVCFKQPWVPADKQFVLEIPEVPAAEQQLTLLSGKILYRFGTTTNSSVALAQVVSAGYIEMNPADAAEFGFKDGGRISLVSEHGQTVGPLRLTDKVPRNLLFAPYHFADVNVRKLIPRGQNSVAVKISKA